MTFSMKAAVNTAYGAPDVLQIREVPSPIISDQDILVKIYATAVSSGDCRLRKADPFAVRFFFGLFKPRLNILGGVFSGEIVAIGKNVQQWKVGDQVFGSTTMQFGAYAEYIGMPENGPIALKPAHISHEEAAAIPFGGVTAWHFLQMAHIQPSQEVLIYGASGAVGSAAVQIAQYLGATVTAVCGPSNLAMVKSLGADHVLDYTQTDFSKNGIQYDVVYETLNKVPVSAGIAAVKPKGTLLLGAAMLPEMIQGAWASFTGNKKVLPGVAVPKAEYLAFLQQLVAQNQFKAVIDRVYPLEQIAEAHRHAETGHKKGNVVIRIVH